LTALVGARSLLAESPKSADFGPETNPLLTNKIGSRRIRQ
jgi:hypothetical protein